MFPNLLGVPWYLFDQMVTHTNITVINFSVSRSTWENVLKFFKFGELIFTVNILYF